jgi:hypothetical protein
MMDKPAVGYCFKARITVRAQQFRACFSAFGLTPQISKAVEKAAVDYCASRGVACKLDEVRVTLYDACPAELDSVTCIEEEINL